MAAVSGLILLKLLLFKTSRHSGVTTIAAFRDYLLTPPVLIIALAIFAWACWVTWRLDKADNDVRLLLQVLLGLEVFFFLVLLFVEDFPGWRLPYPRIFFRP